MWHYSKFASQNLVELINLRLLVHIFVTADESFTVRVAVFCRLPSSPTQSSLVETLAYASVNSSCDHPPPPGTVGHLYAYLSLRPGICSCVLTRGPGICQYRVITPGHLSLTEKRPRPRVSFVVSQMIDYTRCLTVYLSL
jgi:hypothetical protein